MEPHGAFPFIGVGPDTTVAAVVWLVGLVMRWFA